MARRIQSPSPNLPAATVFLLSLHAKESGVKWVAFGVALMIHCAMMFVSFPEFKQAVAPQRPANSLVVRRYVPPPPKVSQPRRQASKQFTRKIPVPDLDPSAPEPIRERLPEFQPEPFPDDAEFLIGVPPSFGPVGRSGSSGRRAAAGPLMAGVGGVTRPVRIESSYVRPEYPKIARTARVEGRVVLQAVICRDGTVSDVELLSCTQPALGFEDEAIKAVRQWRYEPALDNGHPVDVYFTILVDFNLV